MKTNLREALDNFEKRLVVIYKALAISKKIQEKARQNLEKETNRLRKESGIS